MEEYEAHAKRGIQLFEKEKFMDAIRELTEAVKLADAAQPEVIGELYSRLSQAYYALNPKDPSNSEKYCLMSIEIHRKLNDVAMVVMDLINLAYIYGDSGSKQQAERSINEAIKTAEESNDAPLVTMARLTQTEFISKTAGGREKALEIYRDISQSSKKSEDWEAYFEAQHGIATIMREMGNSEESYKVAYDSIEEIIRISGTIKNQRERKSFKDSFSYLFDLASDIAMENGDVDEAIKIAQKLASE